MSDPILFVRPDPTTFALLITKTGRGTPTVVGTEHLKPSGTEWATDQDLRDAGYVRGSEAKRIAQNVQFAIEDALASLLSLEDSDRLTLARKALQRALVETAKLGENAAQNQP